MDAHLLVKFSKIKLLAFDLDGVLTNGKLLIQKDQHWLREMDIKDGLALQMAIQQNFQIAVITGSYSDACAERLKYLGVKHFIQKAKRKSEQINELMSTYQLHKEEVLFMGDDLPDLDAFSVSGLKTCPADAATEIKIQADYISPRNGGDGAVRDVIEKVMRTQDKWQIQGSTQSI